MGHQVTARVSDDLNDQIEAFSDEIDGTKADAIRTLLERGLDFNEIKRENQRLKDQLAATNSESTIRRSLSTMLKRNGNFRGNDGGRRMHQYGEGRNIGFLGFQRTTNPFLSKPYTQPCPPMRLLYCRPEGLII